MQEEHIIIRTIDTADFGKAMGFAGNGMNFDRYTDNGIALRLYTRFALYEAVLKSTTVLGAYRGEELVGFIFGRFKGSKVRYNHLRYQIYCSIFKLAMKLVLQSGGDEYDHANKAMLSEYRKNAEPDGELTFFAVSPTAKGQGIGTKLLNRFAELHTGKTVYLYTDTGCTWQFYPQRGFDQAGRRDIIMHMGGGNDVPLTCMLFSKTL